MNLEKKQQARELYFQTELTKSQIAHLLSIPRRTLGYWIREESWDALRESTQHMPAILAENCYHIFAHLTELYLSERRVTNPVSSKEIDALHKLVLTIGKLKNRCTVNESVEMMGFFMERMRQKDSNLADAIAPHIEEYISSRASITKYDVLPERLSGSHGRIPWPSEDKTEEQIDYREDYFSDPFIVDFYAENNLPFPSEEEISSLPHLARQNAENENEPQVTNEQLSGNSGQESGNFSNTNS